MGNVRRPRGYQAPIVTKPGKYGTLYLYRLSYTDEGDQGCPTFTMTRWRYSEDHAIDAFYEGHSEDTGWKLVKIERIRDAELAHKVAQS